MKLKKRTLILGLIIILLFNMTAVAENDNELSSYPMLAPADTWYQGSVPRSSFTTITVVDAIDSETAASASESWNAGTDYDEDGILNDDIRCYVNGTELIIAGDGSGKILMNFDSSCAFSDSSTEGDYFSNVTGIANIGVLDTSVVVTMRKMFLNACSLETVDVGGFDTSMVMDMSYMFASTISAKEMSFTHLDVSNWDTSNVLDMNRMFQLCSSLEELEVGGWDTSKVTSMSGMFQRCRSLKTLDVSRWDTSSVENLSFMFHCENMPLGTIDVSGWDVSKVLTFDHFIAHARLKLIGVENWKNSVVVVMNAMFHMSRNTVLDVSGFDTSNVITFDQMFEGCDQLTEIIGLENFDTSESVGFSEMFSTCSRLTKLNLASFDTRKAANDIQISSNGKTSNTLYHMFYGTIRLKEIKVGENFSFNGDGTNTIAANVGAFSTPSATFIPGADGFWYNEYGEEFLASDIPDKTAGTYYAVFPGAKGVIASGSSWYKGNAPRSSVTKITITDSYTVTGNETELWDASSLQDNSVMCYMNGSEITIAGNNKDVVANKDSSYMFSYSVATDCFTNLESVDGLEYLDTSMATNMNHMFYGCNNLERVDISNFETSKVLNMNGMFENCTNLKTIYVSGLFNTNSSPTSDNMFAGCSSLTGGNGTAYNSDCINSSYAVIDTDEAPGYFTEKEMAFEKADYSGDGSIQVKVAVSRALEKKNRTVIIALYTDETMVDSYCVEASEEVSHIFEYLPKTDSFTVKVFCWTSLDDIVPVCAPISRTVRIPDTKE